MKQTRIKNILDGEICFVLGGGPSAVHVPHENVITTNLAFRLNPEPLALYFADCNFYQKYRDEVDNVKAKYRITTCPLMIMEQPWITFLRGAVNVGEFNRVAGTNSGLHAIHVAVKMGADPIVLVGFDMNDRTHFHGEYLMGETSVAKYTGEMEIMRGRNIITTTENSGLSHIFPYRPLREFV
jgi:hypothetical protein